MSALFALIADGRVSNVIVADAWPDGVDLAGITPQPGIGWSYDGKTFTAPQPEPVTTAPFMSHFGFLNRFTPQQRLAIRALTDKTSQPYDPILDDAMFLFNSAERIDVGLLMTQQLVGYMASIGLVPPAQIPALLAPILLTDVSAKP